ncbi:MAG TPA: hypothetical protein VF185_04750 [Patescibacteria group bacterium]
MNWTIVIFAVIVFYFIYQIDKRLKKIEESKGLGYSHWFSINAQDAIIHRPKFLQESKLKTSTIEKDYKDWSKEDKDKFGKFIQKNLGNKGWVRVTYLTNEDGFFIKDSQGKTDFQLRGLGSKNLFTEIILGDENDFNSDFLEFSLDVKIEKDDKGQFRDFIIGYLEERYSQLGKKAKVQVLFKFPYNSIDLKIDDYKNFGFEVEQQGGDDIYEDSLGETKSIPTIIYFKKNKTTIQIVE